MKSLNRKISVAPMMDYTDRHCRFIHRLFSPHALLYTEMIVAAAIVRGDASRLLAFDEAEHPVALQLGGCDPGELAAAARIGAAAGYDEINLNVGCPSDRVKNGSFGACLMLKPRLVAQCAAAMIEAVSVPVTVKCRIGIDAREDFDFFAQFIDVVAAAGVASFSVHARNAILKGLSPKENRAIPALKYDYVHRMKRERPELEFVLNGGIQDCDTAERELSQGLDGVMLGRAVCNRPALLGELENRLMDPRWTVPAPVEVIERVVPYARRQIAAGARLHSISRHLNGLLVGVNGARAWRRFLSDVAAKTDATADTLYGASAILRQAAA
jgi:tRNA-dihydrouridine synthase A